MIKAIFFDLDGTLLNSEKVIPQSAVKAMKICKAKGIKLFLATARMPSAEKSLNWNKDITSLFDGGVYCNGAINIVGDEVCYNYINGEVVHSIVTAMKQFPDINISFQSKDNRHAFKNMLSDSELLLWGVEKEKIFSTENFGYEEILKLLIFDGGFSTVLKDIPGQVINIISEICGKLAKLYVTDSGKVIQVGSINASKYNGTEYIRKSLGYDREETAVFGDDLNDMEMIKGYRNSVAMGNGVDEIKAVAGFVTKRNDDDGIAYALEKMIGFQKS